MHQSITVETPGRGTVDVTRDVQDRVSQERVSEGLCYIFIQHTSASLMLCENADPSVRRDLETFMARIAPDADPSFEHQAEGPDDMPAHVRSVITQSHLVVPVTAGRLALGTWQGIYLWEHRHAPHRRRLMVTVTPID